jgi:hypothetical protein
MTIWRAEFGGVAGAGSLGGGLIGSIGKSASATGSPGPEGSGGATPTGRTLPTYLVWRRPASRQISYQ